MGAIEWVTCRRKYLCKFNLDLLKWMKRKARMRPSALCKDHLQGDKMIIFIYRNPMLMLQDVNGQADWI